jgi:hypothetical protein
MAPAMTTVEPKIANSIPTSMVPLISSLMASATLATGNIAMAQVSYTPGIKATINGIKTTMLKGPI